MRHYNKRSLRDMTILGGWLFADLVVALMVIFLAAQPAFPKSVPVTPTPSPKPSPTHTATPTPTPVPRLDFNPVHLEIDDVDYQGILSNTPSAVQHVEQFLNNRPELQNRRAGFVIVYDGAPTDNDIQTSNTIVTAIINNVLRVMGRTELLFRYASYYNNPLFHLTYGHNIVIFDIYLFQQQ